MEQLARVCGDMSLRALKNAIRRLVVVRRQGRARREDLIAAGLEAPVATEPCTLQISAPQRGKVRVALEIDDGTPLRAIMAEAAQALTEAALAEHHGRVTDAMRALGMSKSTWYRIRGGR